MGRQWPSRSRSFPYEVVERIDDGGASAVYRATEVRSGAAPGRRPERVVAIKILGFDPASRDQVEREVERLEKFSGHNHVIQILRSGTARPDRSWPWKDRWTYIVMPYYERGDLAAEVRRRGGPLPLPDAVSIARDIAAALDSTREEDLVHRDVKPENILLTDDGDAVLADFGIARDVDPATGISTTRQGWGTPGYTAPEVLGRGVYSAESDVYSLACTVCFMLTGRPPSGTDLTPDSPEWLGAGGHPLPAPVVAVLAAALSPDPGRRPRTAGVLAEQLAEAAVRPAPPATDPTTVELPFGGGDLTQPSVDPDSSGRNTTIRRPPGGRPAGPSRRNRAGGLISAPATPWVALVLAVVLAVVAVRLLWSSGPPAAAQQPKPPVIPVISTPTPTPPPPPTPLSQPALKLVAETYPHGASIKVSWKNLDARPAADTRLTLLSDRTGPVCPPASGPKPSRARHELPAGSGPVTATCGCPLQHLKSPDDCVVHVGYDTALTAILITTGPAGTTAVSAQLSRRTGPRPSLRVYPGPASNYYDDTISCATRFRVTGLRPNHPYTLELHWGPRDPDRADRPVPVAFTTKPDGSYTGTDKHRFADPLGWVNGWVIGVQDAVQKKGPGSWACGSDRSDDG